jgi:hypothetical protein
MGLQNLVGISLEQITPARETIKRLLDAAERHIADAKVDAVSAEMGYAQEYHIERLLREVLIPRNAPVTPHMILNFLAEKVLEVPKSY